MSSLCSSPSLYLTSKYTQVACYLDICNKQTHSYFSFSKYTETLSPAGPCHSTSLGLSSCSHALFFFWLERFLISCFLAFTYCLPCCDSIVVFYFIFFIPRLKSRSGTRWYRKRKSFLLGSEDRIPFSSEDIVSVVCKYQAATPT